MEEILYYDINFLKKGNFKKNEIKDLILFLLGINIDVKAFIIKDKYYSDYNENIAIFGENEIENIEIIINKENFENIFSKNIITNLSLNINNGINLKVGINFYKDIYNNIYQKISFYFDLDMKNIGNNEDIFYKYLYNDFKKIIKILTPDLVNIGEEVTPISLEEIIKGEKEGEYIYISDKLFNLYNKEQIIYDKLDYGYIFKFNEFNKNLIKIIYE